MATNSKASRRDLSPIELLAIGYAVGVVGTLWDWREHLLGPGTQPPHIVIDLGGLFVLGVLAFSGEINYRSRSFTVLYGLLGVVALIALGPLVLRAVAPSNALTTTLNQSSLSRGALLAYIPLLLLAGWGAWRWLSLDKPTWWRLAASLGIVIVAAGMVWDVYWHQTHPLEFRASMAALPPHQAILAGFLIGMLGAVYGSVIGRKGLEGQPTGGVIEKAASKSKLL